MGALGSEMGDWDLRLSDRGPPLFEAVVRFIADELDPRTGEFARLGATRLERCVYSEKQLAILEGLKGKARERGLWNFFLTEPDPGEGLSNLDDAHIAAELGRSPLSSECFNCSLPDSGNMEVLVRVGTPEQKERWLTPLLEGTIRSAFAMSEPEISSSDATNLSCQAVRDGNECVINSEKYYITSAGDPRCQMLICVVQTDPDAPRHRRPSQILVPMDTPGLQILGPMHDFREDDDPRGHIHLRFTDARAPCANTLLEGGRRFEIAQMRLGPGRIHHCMRSVGVAERALALMVERGLKRVAFGQPVARLGETSRSSRRRASRSSPCASWCSGLPRRWTCSARPRPGCGPRR